MKRINRAAPFFAIALVFCILSAICAASGRSLRRHVRERRIADGSGERRFERLGDRAAATRGGIRAAPTAALGFRRLRQRFVGLGRVRQRLVGFGAVRQRQLGWGDEAAAPTAGPGKEAECRFVSFSFRLFFS